MDHRYNLPTWGCDDFTALNLRAPRKKAGVWGLLVKGIAVWGCNKTQGGGLEGGVAALHAGSKAGVVKPVLRKREKKKKRKCSAAPRR